MKRIISICVAFVLMFNMTDIVSAQTSNITTFGGSQSDYGYGIFATNDGGFVVVGASNSNDGHLAGLNKGKHDATIAKYSRNGILQWVKTFGGSENDVFETATTTADGGYIVVGRSFSNDGDMQGLNNGSMDALLVKFDSNGQIVWKKTFGYSAEDEFRSVLVLPNGDIVVVGRSTHYVPGVGYPSNAKIVKYDQNGNKLWEKTFQGAKEDVFHSVAMTHDGNIVVVGQSSSSDGDMDGLYHGGVQDSEDAIIVKYDLQGNILWKKAFGGTNYDVFLSVSVAPNGDIFAAGYTYSADHDLQEVPYRGYSDAILVNFDPNGNVQWAKNFGGNKDDRFVSAKVVPNKGVVAIAVTNSNTHDMSGLLKGTSSGADAATAMYDFDGSLEWVRVFGGTGLDYPRSADVTPTGNILVVGFTDSADMDLDDFDISSDDTFIIKYDTNGNTLRFSDEDSTCAIFTCNILPGMNRMNKLHFIVANKREYVHDISILVPENYNQVRDRWN